MNNVEEFRFINVNGTICFDYMISNNGVIIKSTNRKVLSGCCNKKGYKVYCLTINNEPKVLKLHRLLMMTFKPCQDMKKLVVDHVEGLDNDMANLRWCTQTQNGYNKKPRNNTSSTYKGVYYNSKLNNYQAYIRYNYKKIHIGVFECEEDAAKAYDEKARALFGEYAKTNF